VNKIIEIGDAFQDIYHIGTSKRLSPEAPIPVVKIEETLQFDGGAANVRSNLRSLGEDGLMLFKALDAAQNYPLKHRLICDGVQIARWDEQDYSYPFERCDLLPLLDADAVVVSDYGKGAITEEVIQILHDYRGPLFVDTKKDPSRWIGSNAVMFPNLKEYQEFSQFYEWFPRVVLKQGANGLSLLEFGKVVLHRPSRARFVKSVNGAGDTAMAGFIVASLTGADLPWCLEFANCAAALAVESDYTFSPLYEDVIYLMNTFNRQVEGEE